MQALYFDLLAGIMKKNFIVVEFDGIIARKLNQTSAFGAWVSQRNTSSYQGSSGPFLS